MVGYDRPAARKARPRGLNTIGCRRRCIRRRFAGHPPSPEQERGMNAQLSAREASPVSLGDWIITLIVLAIPIVGIVMLFVWGFSGSTHPSKQNYCRAALILVAVAFVLWLVFFFTIGASLLHAAMGGATL
jgi:hypothetical protein